MLCTSAARLRKDELTVTVMEGMEEKYMKNVTSHPLEHPCLVLPETNLFPEKENVRLVTGLRRTIFLGYIRENLKPRLEVVGTLKYCNNVECQRDIFFLEKENFLIYRRKDKKKS